MIYKTLKKRFLLITSTSKSRKNRDFQSAFSDHNLYLAAWHDFENWGKSTIIFSARIKIQEIIDFFGFPTIAFNIRLTQNTSGTKQV